MAEIVAFPARIPDASEREQALDIHSSWIVEAPAGSGKTDLLIQRYLKLLADESVEQPEEVLAITFTVKATAELRDRILQQLEGARRQSKIKDDEFSRMTRRLAEAVLKRSDAMGWDLPIQSQRLHIKTIDSICGEIANGLPLLSGSGGRRTPVTTPDPLYREAAGGTLQQLGGGDVNLHEALRTVLLHRDGNLADCERQIAKMLQWRDQWGELIPIGSWDEQKLEQTVRPRLESALEQIVRVALERAAQRFPKAALAELTALAAEMADADRNALDIAACAGRYDPPVADVECLGHWRAFLHLLLTKSVSWRALLGPSLLKIAITNQQKARLKAVLDELRDDDALLSILGSVLALPEPQYPDDQWKVMKALFHVMNHALIELKLVFAESGECDFTEMAVCARTALRQEGGAEEYAAARGVEMKHLLVDEMQDTSLGQYELIEMLTRGWDGHSQTVFLVGDPKQSIYLFRQARVERFLRTMRMEQLGELPLGVLRLSANFRSQGRLVEQFNTNFEAVFASAASNALAGEVDYSAAAAVHPESDAEGMVWHADTSGNASDGDEAEEIRRIVQRWRARELPSGRTKPWQIAVLVRSRSHLAEVLPELKRSAIPFRAVDIEFLGERQEVSDLLALTRALLHTADRVAWLAVLHAPWCGLGLADLHALAGGDDADWRERSMERVIAERGTMLSAEGRDRLTRTWEVLQAALAERGRMTTAQCVERTWRSLGGDAPLGTEEMANVRCYLRLLDEMEREGQGIDLVLLEQRIHKLYAEPGSAPEAVDVMTIHGAKGLEWDVVIVPSLEKTGERRKGQLLSWLSFDSADEDAAHVFLAPIAGKGQKAGALNEWMDAVHTARERDEQRRLFYVACTRAREALHLFAAPARNADDSFSIASDSLLEAAWPAAKEYFAGEVVPFPVARPGAVKQMAAVAEAPRRAVERLPGDFDARGRWKSARRVGAGAAEARAGRLFERPEGSFAARAFGNAVHAWMEVLAERIAGGATAGDLLREVTGWEARVQAVVRGMGVAPGKVRQIAAGTLRALQNTLRDEAGRWVLAAHAAARSEQALEQEERTLRLDRTFFAGAEPLSFGESHLWIVDFKTSDPGGRDTEIFFAQERETYRPQMEAYAAALLEEAGEERPVRLALYYPLAQRLVVL